MKYPFKYPELYAEIARQGKSKKELANSMGITTAGMRYKQTVGDFTNTEMQKSSRFLNQSVDKLFKLIEQTA